MPETAGTSEATRPAVTPDYLLRTLRSHPSSPVYWVAYSGGLDSGVLLHLAARIKGVRGDIDIRALHVHHGLQADADACTGHCESCCHALGIPLTVIRVDAGKRPGQSPEEAARLARYQAIERLIGPGDTVLLAQHRDDQAETLLLQLLRGSGLDGLAAMPERSPLGTGYLLRPLLVFSRVQLDEYANQQGLSWVEDSSNRDPAFDRNFLRREVMPLLRSRWPGLSSALSRSARHCAEARELLASRARERLAMARNPLDDTLSVSGLSRLTPADRRLALRCWIRERGYRMPSASVLGRILTESLEAGPDRRPVVRWREGEIRRYRDALYLLPSLPSLTAREPLVWPPGLDILSLPDGNGTLILRRDAGEGGILTEIWQGSRVEIRYRQGGERIRLPGRHGRHDLRKLFQEAGIPPWVRERAPLIYLDERLAAVGGFWTAEEFSGIGDSSPRCSISWRRPSWLGVRSTS